MNTFHVIYSPPNDHSSTCSRFDGFVRKLQDRRQDVKVLALVREFGSTQGHEHRHLCLSCDYRQDSLLRAFKKAMQVVYPDMKSVALRVKRVYALDYLLRSYFVKEVTPENLPIMTSSEFESVRLGAPPMIELEKMTGQALLSIVLDNISYRDATLTPYVFNKIVSQLAEKYYLVPLKSQMEMIFRQAQSIHAMRNDNDDVVTEWVKMA